MCAFTTLKLGDFVDSNEQSGGTTLQLEPYGVLFVEVRVLHIISNEIFSFIYL
jgi:hypothetical protein